MFMQAIQPIQQLQEHMCTASSHISHDTFRRLSASLLQNRLISFLGVSILSQPGVDSRIPPEQQLLLVFVSSMPLQVTYCESDATALLRC
jgi:hypothetical protein